MSLGFASFEQVAGRINAFIEKNYVDAAGSLVCDIDGGAC
jgi:hypothetical protein